ncbi:Uncharacterised protein [Legionella lansingensis]|uniref:Uncharacterized protein n=1 Tax=Legionella lansingensis TaxID=45067 RepID=A0A0W0V782_9GAMM|nr:hypothetical protein [Legionella lansingensis]KTD15975.1 hypothetical protein Llan_2563 [Legionella lansingensis]SNV56563.1 Uncharacterised protein [Legionella lansingensis]
MSWSKSSGGFKLPTQMIKEKEEKAKKESQSLSDLRFMQQQVNEDFRTCIDVVKKLHGAISGELWVYHSTSSSRIYEAELDSTSDYGIHDLREPSENGGIAIVVDTSNKELCNKLEKAGFKLYKKDWAAGEAGRAVYLISPWTKDVSMKKIEALPELLLGSAKSMEHR